MDVTGQTAALAEQTPAFRQMLRQIVFIRLRQGRRNDFALLIHDLLFNGNDQTVLLQFGCQRFQVLLDALQLPLGGVMILVSLLRVRLGFLVVGMFFIVLDAFFRQSELSKLEHRILRLPQLAATRSISVACVGIDSKRQVAQPMSNIEKFFPISFVEAFFGELVLQEVQLLLQLSAVCVLAFEVALAFRKNVVGDGVDFRGGEISLVVGQHVGAVGAEVVKAAS